jgi:hypothetical protein
MGRFRGSDVVHHSSSFDIDAVPGSTVTKGTYFLLLFGSSMNVGARGHRDSKVSHGCHLQEKGGDNKHRIVYAAARATPPPRFANDELNDETGQLPSRGHLMHPTRPSSALYHSERDLHSEPWTWAFEKSHDFFRSMLAPHDRTA